MAGLLNVQVHYIIHSCELQERKNEYKNVCSETVRKRPLLFWLFFFFPSSCFITIDFDSWIYWMTVCWWPIFIVSITIGLQMPHAIHSFQLRFKVFGTICYYCYCLWRIRTVHTTHRYFWWIITFTHFAFAFNVSNEK